MKSILLLSLLVTISLAACDPPAEECPQVDGLAIVAPPGERWREQGPPMASYIKTWEGHAIHADDFAEAIGTCVEYLDPPLLLTLSGYAPVAGGDARVMGIGSSAIVPSSVWDCFQKHWSANKAIKI